MLPIEEVCKMYGFDAFERDYFDYCLDIGARYGEVATVMAERNSSAKIVAYEPCTANYQKLVDNLGSNPRVTCTNMALGDGADLYYVEMPYDDMHMFVPLEQTQDLDDAIEPLITKLAVIPGNELVDAHAARIQARQTLGAAQLEPAGEPAEPAEPTEPADTPATYTVHSIRIADIFVADVIDQSKRIQVVINSEGGEWSLVNDPGAVVLKSCTAMAVQVHFKPALSWRNERFANMPEWSVFNQWVYDTFAPTHSIKYWCSCKYNGTGIYLINKLS